MGEDCTKNDHIWLGDKIIFFFENSKSIDELAKFLDEYCVNLPNKTRHITLQRERRKKGQIN
jgi:hypothetical protein